jgi:hypothetical protein
MSVIVEINFYVQLNGCPSTQMEKLSGLERATEAVHACEQVGKWGRQRNGDT